MDPAGWQDCANQMVNDEVVAVIQPFNSFGSAVVPVITGAGIPYVVLSAASARGAHHAPVRSRWSAASRRRWRPSRCTPQQHGYAQVRPDRHRRARGHPGRRVPRRTGVRGGRRRVRVHPGAGRRGRHDPADAGGRRRRCRVDRPHRRPDVLRLVPAGLRDPRPRHAALPRGHLHRPGDDRDLRRADGRQLDGRHLRERPRVRRRHPLRRHRRDLRRRRRSRPGGRRRAPPTGGHGDADLRRQLARPHRRHHPGDGARPDPGRRRHARCSSAAGRR